MQLYDPEIAPDRTEWLALDEQERIVLARAFHETSGIALPNVQMHAAIHSVVETQIAEGFEPAVNAMKRLRREGLGRHDAIHAIGSVLAEHLYNSAQADPTVGTEALNRRYGAELARLNVKRWMRRFGPR